MRTSWTLRITLLAAAFLLWPSAPAQAAAFSLVADTSSLAGQSAWLSWYINPGPAPYTLGTAILSGLSFEPGGNIAGPPPNPIYTTTLVSGILGGAPPLTFSNDYDSLPDPKPYVAGEFLLPVVLSAALQFDVALDFPHPNPNDAGTVFVFSIFTDDSGAPGSPAIEMVTQDGALGMITWDPVSGYQFVPNLTAAGDQILGRPLGIPEPASAGVIGAGLLALALLRRRR